MACLIEEKIPPEVLALILEHLLDPPDFDPMYDYEPEHELDFGDLRNARLVCRRWSLVASIHMFRTVALMHGEAAEAGETADFSKFIQLTASPTVQNNARCALIHTGPANPEESDQNEWSRWKNGEYSELVTAINCIVNLPRIQGVHVAFSDRCVGDPDRSSPSYWGQGAEYVWARLGLLRAVFEAIETRALAQGGSNTTITSLTLENLQNQALPEDLLSSKAFESAAKDITELRLHISHEYNDYHPDYDVELPERRNFEPWLHHTFLPIFAENLTVLHISFIERWGVAPGYFDGKGLSFPHLRSLTLGEFVIGHHDQFDWVLAQKTLEILRLQNCAIVSHLWFSIDDHQNELQKWELRIHDWIRHPPNAFGMMGTVFTFPGTWETIFGNIQTHLPNLVDFGVEVLPHNRPHARFASPERMSRELTTTRYITFDSSVCPSPWIPADEYDGEMESGNNGPIPPTEGDGGDSYWRPVCKLNRAQETLEGDTKAFKALIATVDKRRKEKGLD
ncbi:hypothetical protein V8F20_011963 [Naviculisporaceae sp. PSN 640]